MVLRMYYVVIEKNFLLLLLLDAAFFEIKFPIHPHVCHSDQCIGTRRRRQGIYQQVHPQHPSTEEQLPHVEGFH